jgi:hypothetical protein
MPELPELPGTALEMPESRRWLNLSCWMEDQRILVARPGDSGHAPCAHLSNSGIF